MGVGGGGPTIIQFPHPMGRVRRTTIIQFPHPMGRVGEADNDNSVPPSYGEGGEEARGGESLNRCSMRLDP
jgi:hypothetical protein